MAFALGVKGLKHTPLILNFVFSTLWLAPTAKSCLFLIQSVFKIVVLPVAGPLRSK